MTYNLLSFKEGWQSENLARYILSKFSFVASPANISEDIGSDYFCNLFQICEENGHEYLIPENAFTIQIKSKSSSKTIDVSDKIKYMESLKTPFFIGIINRDELKLTIYSGEYLPQLFSFKGSEKLEIELCDNIINYKYYKEKSNKCYVIKFPKITEVKATIGREELIKVIDTLSVLCTRIQKNISSRNNNEYIFYEYSGNKKAVRIFAGKDSACVFRSNFYERLAEVLYNLNWIYENDNDKFDYEEFKIYEHLYNQLKDKIGPNEKKLIDKVFKALKSNIECTKTK